MQCSVYVLVAVLCLYYVLHTFPFELVVNVLLYSAIHRPNVENIEYNFFYHFAVIVMCVMLCAMLLNAINAS